MGFTIVHGASPILQAGLAGIGGYMQARRGAEAEENRAEAQVRSNQNTAIGQGVSNLASTGLGAYFAKNNQTLPAILALGGNQAGAGYIANQSMAEQAQTNRMTMQDDAQLHQLAYQKQGYANQKDYLRESTAYGTAGASPEYLEQIGRQQNPNATPAEAYTLGLQSTVQTRQRDAMAAKFNYDKQLLDAQGKLVNDVEYQYSPVDKSRFAQLSHARNAIMTNPQFTSSPGALNVAGMAAINELDAEMAQIRPTARIREPQPPPLAQQMNAGITDPSKHFQAFGQDMAYGVLDGERVMVTLDAKGAKKINKLGAINDSATPQLPPPPAGKQQWSIGDEISPGFILNTDGKLLAKKETKSNANNDIPTIDFDDVLRAVPKKIQSGTDANDKPIMVDRPADDIMQEAIDTYTRKRAQMTPRMPGITGEQFWQAASRIGGMGGPDQAKHIVGHIAIPIEKRLTVARDLVASNYAKPEDLPPEIQRGLEIASSPQQQQSTPAYQTFIKDGKAYKGYVKDGKFIVVE